MTYRDQLLKVSAAAVVTVGVLVDLWEGGEVSDAELVALVAARVAVANSRAIALADVGLAADLTRMTGRVVPSLGLLPNPEDPARLIKATRSIIHDASISMQPHAELMPKLRVTRAEHAAARREARAERAARRAQGLETPAEAAKREADAARKRLARLADNEPKNAAHEARGEGMRRSPFVARWTRGVNSNSCPACASLAGPILSVDTPMWRHTGCSCIQIPVV